MKNVVTRSPNSHPPSFRGAQRRSPPPSSLRGAQRRGNPIASGSPRHFVPRDDGRVVGLLQHFILRDDEE